MRGADRRCGVLAVLVSVALAACSSPANQPDERPAAAGQPQDDGRYPITVENCGRTLTFDEPPSRVVTGYQPVFETMVALGLGDRIIGRLNFSELGPDGFLPGHKAVYDSIPEISDTIVFPQKEVVLAQNADVVIAESAMSSFDPSTGQATIEELESSGTQVFITGEWCSPQEVLEFEISDTLEDIRDLGMIFGVQERAEKLIAELEGMLADVEDRVGDLEPVRVLASDGGAGPVNAYGGAGLMNEMITLAGGENVLADVRQDYFEASAEQVAASQPEAMLVLDYTTYFGEQVPTAEEKAATVFGVVRNSVAARENRFLPVPAVAAHPGYRNILAIVDIARFLHPEAFDA